MSSKQVQFQSSLTWRYGGRYWSRRRPRKQPRPFRASRLGRSVELTFGLVDVVVVVVVVVFDAVVVVLVVAQSRRCFDAVLPLVDVAQAFDVQDFGRFQKRTQILARNLNFAVVHLEINEILKLWSSKPFLGSCFKEFLGIFSPLQSILCLKFWIPTIVAACSWRQFKLNCFPVV